MKKKLNKKEKKIRRKRRIRAKVFGTATKPRISIFISNKHLYAQVIDDNRGVTLASISDFELKNKKDKKINIIKEMGLRLAEKIKKLKIYKAVFDRGGLKYHGRVKNIAEGLREGGIKL